MKPFINLGSVLKEWRIEMGLTQMTVAKVLGYTSPQFVSNWERGMCLPPIEAIPMLGFLFKRKDDEILKLYIDVETTRIIEEYQAAKKRFKKPPKKH